MTWNKPMPSWHTLFFTIFLIFGVIPASNCQRLKVHLIINSHMDLGWVHTIDEYFTGRHTRYGENVKKMLTGVFDELWKNNARTYTVAELGFLDMWWQSQTQESRDKALTLIKEGRVELLNGGWVANDEACPMYDDIIENFIVGHRWTKETLNHTEARIGWQMDSFGTSMTQAYLMKEAGYEGMFFSRVDEKERERRKAEKSLEFNWQFPNSDNSIFTHLMSRPYYKPAVARARWIAEVFGGGSLSENDYRQLSTTLWSDREYFKTDNIFLLFCGDFWMSTGAASVYKGLDDLVRYYQQHPEFKLDVFYSNVETFVKEVKAEHAEASVTLTAKHDDFFPLNEKPGIVWSGFYTSKANFKGLIRWHSRYLITVKLLASQKTIQQNDIPELADAITGLEKALSIMQHHDAVTGTMKQYVRFDYEDILRVARSKLEGKVQELLLSNLKSKQSSKAVIESRNIVYDNLLGDLTSPEVAISTLPANSNLLLAVMNPGNTRLFLITANITSTPTQNLCVTVLSSDGKTILPDIICQDTKGCSIYFTDTIEAYSWKYYQIKETKSSAGNQNCGRFLTSEVASSGRRITSSKWALQLDDGNTFTFSKSQNGQTTQKQFKLSYSYYESSLEDKGKHHASGAYIFRPRTIEKKSLSVQNQTILWVGKHVAIIQIQSANFTTIIQLLLEQEQTGFSVITQLQPISNATNGCEIVMEIDVPDLQNDGKFFTDSNGYFMLERPYTPASPDETPEEEVAKNYHPITTRCSLEGNSGTEAFTVFTDRAQGASIQKDNQINIMLHRVAVKDDDEGVDEILNEKDRMTSQPIAVTTWHYFLWSDLTQQISAEREETQYNFERPLHTWLFSVNSAFSVTQLTQQHIIPLDLPKALKVNVRTYSQDDNSIRLQNLDPKNSISIILSSAKQETPSLLAYLLQKPLTKPTGISETLWTTTEVLENSSGFNVNGTIKIDLAPLQMRTFKMSFTGLAEEPVKTDTSKKAFPWFRYYIWLHIIAAIVYFLMCVYAAKQNDISVLTFKTEILIVVCLGPLGLVILLFLQRNAKLGPGGEPLMGSARNSVSPDINTELLDIKKDDEAQK